MHGMALWRPWPGAGQLVLKLSWEGGSFLNVKEDRVVSSGKRFMRPIASKPVLEELVKD